MLCSRCSEVLKPVVAVDIDGTLGDYHGHFWNFACNWLGSSGPAYMSGLGKYDGSLSYSTWFCSEHQIADLTTFRAIKLAYRQGGMKRTMPMWEFAPELCKNVMDAGAELWLTTTRPYLSLDGIDRDTRSWLERHGIPYDHLMYDEHKYPVLNERVHAERVIAVVDDEYEQCAMAAQIWGKHVPVQRGIPYNENARFFPRMESLASISNEIAKRIAQWREQYV